MLEAFLSFLPRCFLLCLSRFLALSDIDNDETIADEKSKNVSDDETSENEDDDEVINDEALRDSRARRRNFRFFFYSDRCLTQKLKTKL